MVCATFAQSDAPAVKREAEEDEQITKTKNNEPDAAQRPAFLRRGKVKLSETTSECLRLERTDAGR